MTQKEKFLRREFWTQSWKGSVQHNCVYGADINEGDIRRNKFKKWLCDYCDKELLPMYESQEVSGSVHCQNIKELKKKAESYTKDKILLNGEYKIGTAQKLLNLQLKYLWCAGMSKEPPHCPIDSRILNHVGWDGDSWTTWESIFVYKWAINTITEKAHSEGWKHIADWELRTFNELK